MVRMREWIEMFGEGYCDQLEPYSCAQDVQREQLQA